jgi:hypothetical protein
MAKGTSINKAKGKLVKKEEKSCWNCGLESLYVVCSKWRFIRFILGDCNEYWSRNRPISLWYVRPPLVATNLSQNISWAFWIDNAVCPPSSSRLFPVC